MKFFRQTSSGIDFSNEPNIILSHTKGFQTSFRDREWKNFQAADVKDIKQSNPLSVCLK